MQMKYIAVVVDDVRSWIVMRSTQLVVLGQTWIDVLACIDTLSRAPQPKLYEVLE